MMAAVPPSSNTTNGCTFADIVVNLETSSASYSSRSLARHPSLLNVKLLTYYRWPGMYSSNEGKRAPTTIIKARQPRIGVHIRSRCRCNHSVLRLGDLLSMKGPNTCTDLLSLPQQNSNLQKSKLATFLTILSTSRCIYEVSQQNR